MMTCLLKKANELGWQLSASLDVSAKFMVQNNQEFPIDVHSWFLCKDLTNLSQNTPVQARTSASVPSVPPMSQGPDAPHQFTNWELEDLPPSYSEVMAGQSK